MLSLQNYTKFLNKEQTFFLKIFKISCIFMQTIPKLFRQQRAFRCRLR